MVDFVLIILEYRRGSQTIYLVSIQGLAVLTNSTAMTIPTPNNHKCFARH